MDEVEFENTLNSVTKDVYATLKDKLITLLQHLMKKHEDDLSILFPMINSIEDKCLDGTLMTVPTETSIKESSSSSSSTVKGDVYMVDYSEKTLAVFGNTKGIKDALAKNTGKFNNNLTDPTTKQRAAGWIFMKNKKDHINELLKTLIVNYSGLTEVVSVAAPVPVEVNRKATAATEVSEMASVTTASDLTIPSNMNNEAITLPNIYYLKYSEKSIAVFGDAFTQSQHIEYFKEIGGRFNKHLSNPHTKNKEAGWIFTVKSAEQLKSKGIPLISTKEETVESSLGKRKINDDDDDEDV